jgi:hypothetical protein
MYVEYGYNSQENQDNELRRALAKALKFAPADIAENTQGRISSGQMITLFAKGVLPLMGLIIPLLGLLILGVILYFFLPHLMLKVRFLLFVGKYVMPAIGAFAFGLLAILAKSVMASSRLTNLLADVAGGKAAHTIGRVSISRSDEVEDGINQIFNKRTQVHFFVVKGEYFEVTEEAHNEMHNVGGAGWYSLYYTPRSKFLLSIEPATSAQIESLQKQAA